MTRKQKIARNTTMVIIGIAIFFFSFLYGFFSGVSRTVTSARLVSHDSSSYVIEYDYVGAHKYS